MSARDILHRIEELIDAEIADRSRNARANAIKDCAATVRVEADRIDPRSMTRRADAVGGKLETMR